LGDGKGLHRCKLKRVGVGLKKFLSIIGVTFVWFGNMPDKFLAVEGIK
jgi:hypothetical protein